MKIKCPNCENEIKDPIELYEHGDGKKEYVLKCDKCEWGCTRELWDYNIKLIKKVLKILREQKYENIEESLIIHNEGIISA
jgi:hypothetical protein